jgi:hypothetical protein
LSSARWGPIPKAGERLRSRRLFRASRAPMPSCLTLGVATLEKALFLMSPGRVEIRESLGRREAQRRAEPKAVQEIEALREPGVGVVEREARCQRIATSRLRLGCRRRRCWVLAGRTIEGACRHVAVSSLRIGKDNSPSAPKPRHGCGPHGAAVKSLTPGRQRAVGTSPRSPRRSPCWRRPTTSARGGRRRRRTSRDGRGG